MFVSLSMEVRVLAAFPRILAAKTLVGNNWPQKNAQRHQKPLKHRSETSQFF